MNKTTLVSIGTLVIPVKIPHGLNLTLGQLIGLWENTAYFSSPEHNHEAHLRFGPSEVQLVEHQEPQLGISVGTIQKSFELQHQPIHWPNQSMCLAYANGAYYGGVSTLFTKFPENGKFPYLYVMLISANTNFGHHTGYTLCIERGIYLASLLSHSIEKLHQKQTKAVKAEVVY